MKWQATILLALIAALAAANADDTHERSPSANEGTSEMEEPALPTPEIVPSNPGPGLLPESGELPAGRPTETPATTSTTGTSRGQVPKKEGRFEEIRSLAMSNPRAAYLLKRARSSSSAVARRTYLRAYYLSIGSRMRKLDPNLKSSINAYEETKIHEVSAAGRSSARGSSHRSRLRRTASQAVHHRVRRVSSEYRYRRMMMSEELDGSPVVLYPW
jgi:hypothetical protein